MKVRVMAMCAVCALALSYGSTAARGALLADNASAMSDWKGTLTTDYLSGTDQLKVLIDYAVFQPGQYPGDATNKTTEFIYAYQAFNQTVSTVALTSLSVGLEAGSLAHGIGDDVSAGQPGVAGGISPDISVVGSSSARWGFGWIGGNEVASDQASTVLVFSSPNGPAWDTATMMNGGVPTPVGMLPSPIPEPTTMSLLAIGGLALIRRRRK